MRKSFVYAGRAERLLAFLIDLLLINVPLRAFVPMLHGDPFAYVVIFMSNLLYYTYFTASGWQATPGKRLLGIYVIRADNRLLTSRDALMRFIAFYIPNLLLYSSFIPSDMASVMGLLLSIIWFLPILYTDERMGMHDKLCNTRVMIGKVGT